MIEFAVLIIAVVPFIVGIFAIKRMQNGNDTGSDDQPPPPDPNPPLPVLPPSPERRFTRRPLNPEPGRGAVPRSHLRLTAWKTRVGN